MTVVMILNPRAHILQPLNRRSILLVLTHQPQPLQQRRRRRLGVHAVAEPHGVDQPELVPAQLVRRRPDDPVRDPKSVCALDQVLSTSAPRGPARRGLGLGPVGLEEGVARLAGVISAA